jgi:N-acetyl-anhydromuramyl-L-alanine amidase AmpD
MQQRKRTNQIIIHCSDSPDSRGDIGVKEIRDWHLKRGWSDIGYHFVVKRDGTVEEGRGEHFVGAHTEKWNGKSIGICWVGRKEPTPIQLAKLLRKVKDLLKKYGLNESQVLGHKELNPNKTCPNLDMEKFRALLKMQSVSNDTLTNAATSPIVPKDLFSDSHLDLPDDLFGPQEKDV